MTEEADDSDVTRFGFTYALDRDEFFRRACPSCGREHKVKASADELAHTLDPAFHELGVEIGETEVEPESDDSANLVFCPYCGHQAPLSETAPDALVRYVQRWGMREIILPRLRQVTSELERGFRPRRPASRGLVSFQVIFEADNPSLPPRPIAGPEPPDMKRVYLLCCRREIRVLDGWQDTVVCPFCGIVNVLQ